MQRIEANAVTLPEPGADALKVEQGRHLCGVVVNAVDDLDRERALLRCADAVEVDLHVRVDSVARQRFTGFKMRSVSASGAWPPPAMLYLMPKSPAGPAGLWLAVSTRPPAASR